jgi:hypothetical protein
MPEKEPGVLELLSYMAKSLPLRKFCLALPQGAFGVTPVNPGVIEYLDG